MTQTVASRPSLRARQQLETRREIFAAALDLFEEQGFRGTTVEDIAARVGVSARTVFRYFPTKTDLVIGWLPELAAIVAELPLKSASPAELLAQIEDALEVVLLNHEARVNAEAAQSLLRVRRLIGSDLDLQATTAAWESRLLTLAIDRVREALGDEHDEVTVRLLIHLAAAPITTALEAWCRSNDANLRSLYQDARARRSQLLRLEPGPVSGRT